MDRNINTGGGAGVRDVDTDSFVGRDTTSNNNIDLHLNSLSNTDRSLQLIVSNLQLIVSDLEAFLYGDRRSNHPGLKKIVEDLEVRVDALEETVRVTKGRDFPISSIYIGFGTITLLILYVILLVSGVDLWFWR